jgi:hypothetical protein
VATSSGVLTADSGVLMVGWPWVSVVDDGGVVLLLLLLLGTLV